jgi:hypothetical protein
VFNRLVEAPWSAEQVAALNAYQEAQFHHPYTCPACPADLVATPDGWVCPTGHYKQRWAHATHADGAWVAAMTEMYGQLRPGRSVSEGDTS